MWESTDVSFHAKLAATHFFFSCVPTYISGVHHFGWDFCLCDHFFLNPTIEVVTFHLHGWCMLVCLYCQHSPVLGMNVRIFWVCAMQCMYAQTRSRSTLSSERVLGEWSQNPCQLRGKKTLYRKFRRGSKPWRCITQDSETKTLSTELFRTPAIHFSPWDNRTGWLGVKH